MAETLCVTDTMMEDVEYYYGITTETLVDEYASQYQEDLTVVVLPELGWNNSRGTVDVHIKCKHWAEDDRGVCDKYTIEFSRLKHG